MWSDAWTPLRWLVRGLLLGLASLALVPTLLCISRPGRAIRIGEISLEEFMIRWWSGLICRAFGARVRATGRPLDGPVLIVANHISWLDISALHSTAAMGFVGKSEIGTWPLFGYLARAGDTIFHERGSGDSLAGVSEAVRERLKAGRRVAIFPEGGIRPGDAIGVFHARLFKPAVEAECRVQPAMLRYVRDGKRDPDMTFIDNESFLRNMLRLMGRPPCVAEVHFLQALEATGRPRRELAEAARIAVNEAYESDI